MGIKDFISHIGEKSKERRAMVNQIAEQLRMQKIAEDRMKTPSQRVIERYEEEKNEKFRKAYLERLEKEREKDFSFNHNPLNAKNVTGKTQWEVMKTRNVTNNHKNLFANQKNIFVNNKRCY